VAPPGPYKILDEEGQAFLRIGPDGVEDDFNSPSWFRSNDPTGKACPSA
jgi:hypothetical protein